jgi:hypothetical protein
LIVTTAVAQQDPNKKTPPAAQPPPAEKSETVEVKGTVKAVTDATVTIVDDQKAETTIGLDSTTKVTKSGKEVTVADLKADDSVVVVAKKGEGDVLMAIKITVA